MYIRMVRTYICTYVCTYVLVDFILTKWLWHDVTNLKLVEEMYVCTVFPLHSDLTYPHTSNLDEIADIQCVCTYIRTYVHSGELDK